MLDKLFYDSAITKLAPTENKFTLSEEESAHAVKVLRLTVGAEIHIIDGQGGLYAAKITIPHPKHCGVEITKRISNFGKRNYRIHIAIAPTKLNERMEWFFEKVTEIGIDEITPLLCAHSERKEIKNIRMEKIIISAMKQSKKAFCPKLNEMTSILEFFKNQKKNSTAQKFIAHCEEGKKISLKNAKKGGEVIVLIGPEGDFSPQEITAAQEAGFTACSLGESRLRTETAGIVACHTLNLINEE